MKKIICTTVLKDLSGKDFEVDGSKFTLGHAIANIIVSDKSGGKMKLYTLGTRFYQNDSVELDEADFTLVKTAVKNSEAYGALICGQVEAILETVDTPDKKVK